MSFIRARSVFISDTHLGTYGSQAEKIIELLDSISVEKLYLVGDIIDGWQLQSKWYWPETHSFVLEKIIKISENGTKVFYISGNHDDFLRKIGNFKLGGITFCKEVTHITPDNKKFLVIHRDKYDQVIAKVPWVAYILDELYNFFQFVNRKLNIFLKFFGFKYFSLIDIFFLPSLSYPRVYFLLTFAFHSPLEKAMELLQRNPRWQCVEQVRDY